MKDENFSKVKMTPRTALDLNPSMWRQYQPFRSGQEQSETSSSIAEAHNVANSIAAELVNRFGAKKVVLFGSLATGEFNQWSDIDIAVWGIPPTLFYKAVAFASGVSNRWKVDLVDAEDCQETLLRRILREGIES